MWTVVLLDEAESELRTLPAKERQSFYEAMEKLRTVGPFLGAPHTSNVEGVVGTLRELRPRQGRSPWRALYRRIGDELVVGAIGPEAQSDRRGFIRAVTVAMDRLESYETGKRGAR